MMFRPTLLLWGAVAITSAPVWADKIPDADVAKQSPGIESPVKAAHRPDLNLNALLVAAFPAEPTQAVTLTDTLETNDGSAEEQPKGEIPAKVMRRSGPQVNASVNAESLPELTPELAPIANVLSNNFFDFGGWWFSEPKNRFFRSLPDTNVHPASVSYVDSQKPQSSISRVGQTWRTGGRGSRENFRDRNPNNSSLLPAVAVVPEPGSLSLLLLGLAAVGFLGRWRGELLIAI